MTDQSRTQKTHFADDETLAYIAKLEREAADLRERLAKAEQNPVFSSLDMLTRKTYRITASQQEPVAVHTRNLANDPLYKSLDALYRRGWTDRSKERDYDPRGTIQWQETLDLFRRYTAALAEKDDGWIKCSERLPEDGQHVWIGGINDYGSEFQTEVVYIEKEWLMFDQAEDIYCWPCRYQIYWRPLPPLPKGDE